MHIDDRPVHRPEHRRRAPSSAAVAASTYRRRRAVAVAGIVSVLAAGGIAAHGVLSVPGGVPASAAGVAPTSPRRAVVAHRGDTLWALARTHHGAVDVDRYLDELIELNGGTAIQAGQQVLLP